VEVQIGTGGKFRRATVIKKPKHGRWVDVYDDVSKTPVRRVKREFLRQLSDGIADDVEFEGGLPELHDGMRGDDDTPPRRRTRNGFSFSRGSEVEAQIGTGGKFRRATVIKKPKHGRWVDVYDDVSKTPVRRVKREFLRQLSDEIVDDVEFEGGLPELHDGMRGDKHASRKRSRETFEFSRGSTVEAQIGTGGKFRRATVIKKPKHGRWVDVYDDVSKTPVRRVKRKFVRQLSDEGADDVEYEGGLPEIHSGMKRGLKRSRKTFEFSKGSTVEAKIGTNGTYRQVVVVKRPKHSRWVNVYCAKTSKTHERVPMKFIRQLSDFDANDMEQVDVSSFMPAISGTATLGDALWPKKGCAVEVNCRNDVWETAYVTLVPRHRRWFNVYLAESKQIVKRLPKSRIRKCTNFQDDDVRTVLQRIKPHDATKKDVPPRLETSNVRSFRFEAYRSSRAGAIKAAMARILASRVSTLEPFKPKKGDVVEYPTSNGRFRRATVVKKPKHGRWLHLYDDIDKKLIKKVPSASIRQQSDDRNRPVDLELE